MTARYERQARLTDSFTQVPHGLWTANLSWGAKCLLGWLHSHEAHYVKELSNHRIRKELGCSGIVSKWFTELEGEGFIRVERDGKRQRVVILAEPWEALATRKQDRSKNGHTEKPEPDAVAKRSAVGQETVNDWSLNDYIEYQVEHQAEQHTQQTSQDITQVGSTDVCVLDGFDAFWMAYPRSEGKQPAKRAWGRLNEAERFDALEALPRHVQRWSATGTERRFIPHAATWINQRRWEDQFETGYQPQGTLAQRVAQYSLARRKQDATGASTNSVGALGRADNRLD